ncbi:polysialyltransferase family glycosyltransferase [Gloeocapsa sp. BRSZ]
MSQPKTIKRLIACFGSIQLVTVLSVLSYREKEQQELNYQYEDYLVITPLFTPQGQNEEFAAFIEKMAHSMHTWKNIVYLSLEQIKAITNKIDSSGFFEVSKLAHNLLCVENPSEIYLSRTWNIENQLLMNVYENAEKICYGDGIGIYFSHTAFLPQNTSPEAAVSLSNLYKVFKRQIKAVLPRKKKFRKQEFDLGYFSLPYAFGEVPPMETTILDKSVYLKTFQTLRKALDNLVDADYINNLKATIQGFPVSILLSSNFSEARRMGIEQEIEAYREFLLAQGIPNNSILLIKPHPRDSKEKILQMQSSLNDLYAKIILLNEDFLFYLPFEVLFMELFLFDFTQSHRPKIFTFSSASLTLEFLFDVECIVGFGKEVIEKYFYPEHMEGRIKHEADLQSTINEVRGLIAA